MTARVVGDSAAARAQAIEVLAAGGIVALPTDTVYGIAVALSTPGGIERLFAAKRRPPDKGIVLLLDDAAQAATAGAMTTAASALADALWPGGLTVIVPQRADVPWPSALTGGVQTIGLRVPDHPAPRALAAGGRALADDVGECIRPSGGIGRRSDPRPARRLGRSRARRRTCARRPGVHGRRLQRLAAGDHPRRRGLDRPDRGGRWTRPESNTGFARPIPRRAKPPASRSDLARRHATCRRSRHPARPGTSRTGRRPGRCNSGRPQHDLPDLPGGRPSSRTSTTP